MTLSGEISDHSLREFLESNRAGKLKDTSPAVENGGIIIDWLIKKGYLSKKKTNATPEDKLSVAGRVSQLRNPKEGKMIAEDVRAPERHYGDGHRHNRD